MTSRPFFKKLAIATALTSFSAVASATVLTSIKPLGFIASSIANGVTDTKVLVPAGASPHDYSLKPSDVQKLKNAELIVWIGKDVDIFLDSSLHNFPKEKLLTIADLPAVDEDVLLTGHHHHHHHGVHADDHDHDEAHEEHHDHDHDEAHEEHHDHDHDEAHEDHHDHDHDEAHEDHHDHDHDEAHEEHHDHDHDEAHEEDHDHDHDDAHEGHNKLNSESVNWHIWYSPEISRIVAKNIADKLIVKYPNKKVKIQNNLVAFNDSLTKKNAELKKQLKPIEDKGFYVFHDAYTYFNKAYDLKQLGYFTINPLVSPGVKTLAKIKQEIKEHKVQCLFAEPQFTPKVIKTLSKATGVKVGTLDPMGDKIALGQNSYTNFLQSMANSYLACLK